MTEESKRKGRVTRSARCGRAFRALIPAALLALLAGCGSENGQSGTMVSNAAAGDRLASVDETGRCAW